MDHMFVTSTGRSIALRPVSQILLQKLIAGIRQEFVGQGKILDAPTYTVETAGGPEEFPHDETSIQDENTTDEDRAAWSQYQNDIVEFEQAINTKTMEVLLRRGILERPDGDDWVADQEYDGISVPEDARERLLHWFQTELFDSTVDLARCVAQIMLISSEGIPEDRMRAVEDTFRRAMGGPERADDPGPETDTTETGQE